VNCREKGCPPLPLGGKACHCASCHRTFTTVTAFDMHRYEFACSDPAGMTRRDGSPALAVIRKAKDGSPVWGQNGPQGRQFAPRAQNSGPLGENVTPDGVAA
jgi:hypothetical protein